MSNHHDIDDIDAPLFGSESESPVINIDTQDMPVWHIVIIDDEQAIHDVTIMALKRFTFQHKQINFHHAFSAAQAKELLPTLKDVAVILLDVVMEEDDSGLKLVDYIRNTLNNSLTRIILRTGQPGAAPPQQITENYDINDYKDKTELTVQKLNQTVITALRSYRDLKSLEQHRQGLEEVITATSFIHQANDFSNFISGLLTQILAVLQSGNTINSVVSAFVTCSNYDANNLTIKEGTGIFETQKGKLFTDILSPTSVKHIQRAIEKNSPSYDNEESVFLFEKEKDIQGIIYIAQSLKNNTIQRRLLELFCSNISVAYENIKLHDELEQTQLEIILTLGNIAEFRSKETSHHVKRVSLYTEIIAKELGIIEPELDILTSAAALHDIGKIIIPDNILHKPGPLSTEEFDLIKSHTSIGYDLLKNSKRDILKAGAIIAKEHQEKWNGSGYPDGLSGKDIHLYGRIVAVADVFDALSHDRCYKKAWPQEAVINFIKEQRGIHFDPEIADIFLNKIEDVYKIHDYFS